MAGGSEFEGQGKQNRPAQIMQIDRDVQGQIYNLAQPVVLLWKFQVLYIIIIHFVRSSLFSQSMDFKYLHSGTTKCKKEWRKQNST